MKDRVEVSPDMLTFVGKGAISTEQWPLRPLMVLFTQQLAGSMTASVSDADEPLGIDEACLVLVVARHACGRLFPGVPTTAGRWHLPADLSELVHSIAETSGPTTCRDTLRLAKSLELLCCFWTARAADALLPVAGHRGLSARDTARIVAARRVVDERWGERLTLDAIARACGLNRAQLTSGFRHLYDCTVADAITGNRLDAARRLVLRSDMPMSAIGYSCGYSNNASFTRAFSRHFGVAPSRLRQGQVA